MSSSSIVHPFYLLYFFARFLGLHKVSELLVLALSLSLALIISSGPDKVIKPQDQSPQEPLAIELTYVNVNHNII